MLAQIIGIDCATKASKVGIAAARNEDGALRLIAAQACAPAQEPWELVARWIREVDGATLLALDAPLGWPRDMSESLSTHAAGGALPVASNTLFRRRTDRFIAERLGKTPLDVGADRIARTAHWALGLLETLRAELDEPIPLAWSPDLESGVAAIEVYPAATLLSHGIGIRGYKGADGADARAAIHVCLSSRLRSDPEECEAWTVDTLDAAVCVLAGLDFAGGDSIPPADAQLALKEGWIWVRDPAAAREITA